MNIKYLAAAALFAVAPGIAGAVTITPVAADCDSNGLPDIALGAFTCSSDPSRTDIAGVNYGVADGDFYSLGIGGIAAFEVAPPVSGPGGGMVVEVTNPGTTHFEAMSVWVGNLADFSDIIEVAKVTNVVGGVPESASQSFTIDIAGTWRYILFQDTSKVVFASSGTKDGFDIDAFTVSTVPVPAAGFLLLAGLGGLAAMKRRKKA